MRSLSDFSRLRVRKLHSERALNAGHEIYKQNIMKNLLKLAVLAASIAAPVFAEKSGGDTTQGVECIVVAPLPDGGATALLAAISFGGLYIAKRATKKR